MVTGRFDSAHSHMRLKAKNKAQRASAPKHEDESAPELKFKKELGLNEEDYPFLVREENPDFDPERNRRLIQEVAVNNWENRMKIRKEFGEKLGERADAVEQFTRSETYQRNKGNVSTRLITRYFGKGNILRLRGAMQDVVEDPFAPELVVRMGHNGSSGKKQTKKNKKKEIRTTELH